MEFPLTRDCFVTSITLVALNKLGQGLFDMDPLLVRDAVEDVFGLKNMPQRMFDKLNCGLMLLGTSSYTDSIEGFLMGTAVMNNQVVNGNTIAFCNLKECAWGVWEYMNLNGDVDEHTHPTEQFSPDIVKYIQEAGRRNGVTSMPEWLKFAEKDMSALPDLTSDIDQFEMYMKRQDDYVSILNLYVQQRQDALTQQLMMLNKLGLIGPKQA